MIKKENSETSKYIDSIKAFQDLIKNDFAFTCRVLEKTKLADAILIETDFNLDLSKIETDNGNVLIGCKDCKAFNVKNDSDVMIVFRGIPKIFEK